MPNIVKSQCEVVSVIKHNDRLSTLELKPLKRITKYSPGHFLHLALDEYDPSRAWPESRVFSIANYDPSLSKIRITYNVKGKFTKRMYDSIQPFNRVLLSGNQQYSLNNLSIKNGTDGLRLAGNSSFLSNSIIRNMESCSISYGTGNFEAGNIIVLDSSIGLLTQATGTLNNSLFLHNDEGTYIDDVVIDLNNCYFVSNRIGVRCLYGASVIKNNLFDKNRYAVSICAANPTVKNNKFCSNNTDIEMNRSWVSYQVYHYCSPTIEDNNFFGDEIYISLYGKNIIGGSSATQGVGVNSNQHYPKNYYRKDNLSMHLFDYNYPGSNVAYTIDYMPRRQAPNPIAGIL